MSFEKEEPQSQPSVTESGSIVNDWDADEERKLIRKVDFYVLPLLLIAFFFLCLDRSNISNALTDHFITDLGITTAQATLGNQLQQAGIIIFELPANILLARVRAHRWLVFQMLAWGCIATFQCFIQNRAQYYATRFLLGVVEGGFIPGAMYLLSEFYPRSVVSTRFAIFYYGNYIASGTSTLIAAGLLTLDGIRGWSGWRWLFLVDGAMTLTFSLVLLVLLPGSPPDTRPVHKSFNLFSPREGHLLQTLQLSSPSPSSSSPSPSLLKALTTPTPYLHFTINLLSLLPAGGLVLFGPTILESLSFHRTTANALIAVGYFTALPLALGLSIFASRTHLTSLACLLSYSWCLVFVGLFYHFYTTTTPHTSPWTLYALFTLIVAGMLIAQPVNNAWCSRNARNERERSVGLALCVIGSNLGGAFGAEDV
ncbi:MFS general substrate transporter [Aspergillus sclerotiicarbonarius CBS 121057]|uniref:MFS general substrate transporter n=1 Tax=Aspergillus sclerotiicarbonarius (strain CBS 121057 / IBT 28362) TaxID=1448318 RepID=A0A319DZ90_ASPSB|nr:MFS general substrate transporter [Aspergillus sclerotiicarbonarius CBS 121057]